MLKIVVSIVYTRAREEARPIRERSDVGTGGEGEKGERRKETEGTGVRQARGAYNDDQ